MSRMIHCVKLNKLAKGLERQPYPGTLGEKIFSSICADAWAMWLAHQTLIINEYRLSMIEPKARQLLEEEMEKFLFTEGDDTIKPEGFVAPEK